MGKFAKYSPIIAIAALIAAIAAGLLFFWTYSTTVVLVVRHAEKNTTAEPCTAQTSCPISGQDNPPLSGSGETRATTLAHVVEDTGIQAIYASCFCRTQKTVEPTATAYNLTTNLVSQSSDADITNLVNQINTNNVGQKVLVAGHTSTVPKIIEKLGGGTINPIAEDEFDNLYVVTITRGWLRWFGFGKRVRVVRLKYGVPTPAAP